MWIAIIFVLVIAMALGPVLLLQPSKRTQQLAQLRAQASALGLQVRLGDVPGQQDTATAVYLRPWPEYKNRKTPPPSWILTKRSFSHDIHYADHWDWYNEGRPSPGGMDLLKGLLEQLPDSVLAVEANASGVSCYWQERGGLKVLEDINHWLDDLVTSLALPSLPKANT